MTDSIIDVTAAIIRRSGRILIAQRPPLSFLGGMWEFPGGKIEPNETASESLQREIQEELGVTIAVGKLVDTVLHKYKSKEGAQTYRIFGFLCAIAEGEPKAKEHSDIRWVLPGDILTYNLLPADIPLAKRVIKEYVI